MSGGVFMTEGGRRLRVAYAKGRGKPDGLAPQNVFLMAASDQDSIAGTVRHRKFLRSRIRYIVDTEDGQMIVDTLNGSGIQTHAISAAVALRVDTRLAPLLV